MSTAPIRTADDSDLLLPLEQQLLPSKYKEYYRAKRANFFASIQRLPDLWKLYTMLDQIWLRELDALRPGVSNRAFPILLYINAHAKIRVGVELGLACCISEGRSIMRDAVESVAHAHHMLKDPKLQEAWLNKNDDKAAFNKEFWDNKGERLFADLKELFDVWRQLSEIGSHTNVNSICERVKTVEVDGEKQWALVYTGLPERQLTLGIFTMLLMVFVMEDTFFKDYRARFQFDEKLLIMRGELNDHKERVRASLTARYNIKRAEAPLIVLK
jgi:hypothetical protein